MNEAVAAAILIEQDATSSVIQETHIVTRHQAKVPQLQTQEHMAQARQPACEQRREQEPSASEDKPVAHQPEAQPIAQPEAQPVAQPEEQKQQQEEASALT